MIHKLIIDLGFLNKGGGRGGGGVFFLFFLFSGWMRSSERVLAVCTYARTVLCK